STEMLELLKADLGVLEEGRNYNEIIDGHGTGLRPPSEDDWDEIARTWHLMDGFSVQGSLPSTLDHSVSMYFPPVGDQGGEGSCVAFSNGYYTSTFYEARDRGWDLSGASWTNGGEPTPSYQNRIFSPDFIYHQINDGEDGGSSYLDAQKLLSRVGVSSWEKMPYDTSDHTSWPSESAWREAPRYRNGMNVISYLTVRTDQDILTIKSYLAAGYLVSVSIDANQYKNLTEKDVWNTSTYIYPDTNHANTIVGYDDNFNGSL
ncbi:C1 family peptidase, partial [Mesotoga prima]